MRICRAHVSSLEFHQSIIQRNSDYYECEVSILASLSNKREGHPLIAKVELYVYILSLISCWFGCSLFEIRRLLSIQELVPSGISALNNASFFHH